jgi:hypothetical protein
MGTVEDHPVCNPATASLAKQRFDISQKEDSEQLNVSDRLVRGERVEQDLGCRRVSRAIDTAPRRDSGRIDGLFNFFDVFHCSPAYSGENVNHFLSLAEDSNRHSE